MTGWYSQLPHNPYHSVIAPGYGLWESMDFEGVTKNRHKNFEKYYMGKEAIRGVQVMLRDASKRI